MTLAVPATMPKATEQVPNDDSVATRERTRQALKCLPQHRTQVVPAATSSDPYQLTTVQPLGIPDDFKGGVILQAYGRTTGSAGTGPLTVAADGATPSSGEIAMAPNGEIVTLGTDALTSVDVQWAPGGGNVVEYTGLPVNHSTGLCALPAEATVLGVKRVIQAELTAIGATGVIGKKIVLVPGAAPATTKANLNVPKTGVYFAPGDVGSTDGTARVRLLVAYPQE